MAEIFDKAALARDPSLYFNPPATQAPPPDKGAEAPPPPPAPEDKVDPNPGQNAAPPAPPAGIPNHNGEPTNPLDEGRRLLHLAEETGDTDDLAQFLRDLRRSSASVANGVATQLYNEAGFATKDGKVSLDHYESIQNMYRDFMGIKPSAA
jgi:hypothetical protein